MGGRVQQALARALQYLGGQQLPRGEFRMYLARAAGGRLADERQLDSTPFVTPMMVYSLGFVHTDQPWATQHGLPRART